MRASKFDNWPEPSRASLLRWPSLRHIRKELATDATARAEARVPLGVVALGAVWGAVWGVFVLAHELVAHVAAQVFGITVVSTPLAMSDTIMAGALYVLLFGAIIVPACFAENPGYRELAISAALVVSLLTSFATMAIVFAGEQPLTMNMAELSTIAFLVLPFFLFVLASIPFVAVLVFLFFFCMLRTTVLSGVYVWDSTIGLFRVR